VPELDNDCRIGNAAACTFVLEQFSLVEMADSRVAIAEHIVNPTLHPRAAENSLSSVSRHFGVEF